MRDIHNVSLLDILPPNLAAEKNVRAAALAIDGELAKVTETIQLLALDYNVDDLPEEWVNELAWQSRVDFYDTSLPLEIRRDLVKKSDSWKRRKGTPSAVEELVTSIFSFGKVEEWWEYGGAPYTFRVVTTNPAATTDMAEQFIAAVESVKNKRSRLESVRVDITWDELEALNMDWNKFETLILS